LSGHVHQSPFVPDGSWADRIGETWGFNAGHQVGPIPSHIVVDLDDARAFWLSLLGQETIDLGGLVARPVDTLRSPPGWLTEMARLADRRLA
jgi:hypothetical protein